MQKPLLEVRNLKTIYTSDRSIVHAVNNIDFSIGERETLGLVGETGAGKTTTALSILRLLPERSAQIREGEILFRGRDLLKCSKEEMRSIRGAQISMIFQDPMSSLNPTLTVGQQIVESLEIHNTEKKNKQELKMMAGELLEMVGIPATRYNEYPHQFSGGMKQRVVIAIALACKPELIIADEPTTALDVTIQAQVLSLINDLKEKLGTSMILITHDLGVVAQTCENVAIMYAGEIVEIGTLHDIFEGEKHHPYTTGLFGAIPDLDVETDRLKPIYGLMPDPTNLPTGCKFHPRCSHCMEICKKEKPPKYVEGKHIIACHLYAGEA